MLPLVWGAKDPSATLAAYNGLYLREEVQMEGLVRDVGAFARFLEAMSFSHAAVLNLSNVAQHLRAWCDYSTGKHSLYYWQTRSKVEIDFIIYGESGMYALEVKNSARVRPSDLRPLTTFGQDYPDCRRILIYRGTERFVRNGVLCLPAEEFLRALQPNTIPE